MNICKKKLFIVTVVKKGYKKSRKVIFIYKKKKNGGIIYKKDKIFNIKKDFIKIKIKNGSEEFNEIIEFSDFNNKDLKEFDFDEITNIEINKKYTD